MNNKEKRILLPDQELHMRALEEDGKRYIQGYGIVYNQRSKMIFENGRFFYEVIEKGAATRVLNADSLNVVMTLDHNNQRMLAAFTKDNGVVLRNTLEIIEDELGVMYRFEVPDTADGQYAYEMVRNGSIIESSFVFIVSEENQRWNKTDEGDHIRYVKELDGLYDMSVISNRGAYSNTDVEVALRHLKEIEKAEAEEQEEERVEKPITHDVDEMTIKIHRLKS